MATLRSAHRENSWHHHLELSEHGHRVHLWHHSLSHSLQILMLWFRDMQIDIDFFIDEKSFDLFWRTGAHETGECGLLRLVVNEAHQSIVFDVLGVLDQTGRNLPEDLESLLHLLFGEVLTQITGKYILFVFVVLMDRAQRLETVGFLLRPVHINVLADVEGVDVLHFLVGVVGLSIVFEANEGERQALVRICLNEEGSHLSESFACLSKSILYFLFGQLRQVFYIKVIWVQFRPLTLQGEGHYRQLLAIQHQISFILQTFVSALFVLELNVSITPGDSIFIIADFAGKHASELAEDLFEIFLSHVTADVFHENVVFGWHVFYLLFPGYTDRALQDRDVVCLEFGGFCVLQIVIAYESETARFLCLEIFHHSERKYRTEFYKNAVQHFFGNLLFEVSDV
jgi:hypothetical protein